MNKFRSMLTFVALVVIAGTGFGCYSYEGRGRRVYEPAGSPRDYRYDRDGGYYDGRYYHDYDGRYNDHYEHHQWDNPNYRR